METHFKSNLILALIFNVFILNLAIAASDSPQSFTFQGRLFNAAGTDPLDEPVTLNFQIYDPSANCLLYQESQSVNLTNQSGVFAVSVGSAVLAAKRTPLIDPGYTMARIFKNDPLVETRSTNVTYCPGGYTPTAGDYRLLRITVTPSSTGIPEVLSPDQIINSVPHALVAETLQGLAPADFIQKDPIYVTDARVKKIFGSLIDGVVDASALHHHDGRYIQISSSSAQDLGSGGFNTSGKGSIGTSSNFTNTTMSVKADADTNVGLAIRASSVTQSADLFQVQNSAGTKIAGISASGGLTAATSVLTSTSGSQLIVQHDTSNKQTVDVNSTGTTSFTAAGSAPAFSFMGGNVGIGMPGPAYALDVNGPIRTNSYIYTSAIEGLASTLELFNTNKITFGNGGYFVQNLPNSYDLAVFTGTTPAQRMTWSANGNVGIGTTSPAEKLSVVGNIIVPNSYAIGWGNRTTQFVGVDSTAGGYLRFDTGGAEKMRIISNGNVGIGTNAPGQALDFGVARKNIKFTYSHIGETGSGLGLLLGNNLRASTTVDNQLEISNSTVSGAHGLYSVYNQGWKFISVPNGHGLAVGTAIDPNTYTKMAITSDGNVGIGTTTPTLAKLQVAPGAAGVPGLRISGPNDGIYITRNSGVDGAYAHLYTGIASFDYLNIDTNSGTNGGISVHNIGALGVNPVNNNIFFNGYNKEFKGFGAVVNMIIVGSTGNVGIGTTTPSEKLHVVGNILASGTITPSDRRLKKNIEPVRDAVKKLTSLQGVTYDWQDPEKHSSARQMGVIAQDVQRVFPEAVIKTNDGFLAVSYSVLVSPIIEAIKELSKKIIGIEDKNQEQSRKIASIESRNERLMADMEAIIRKNQELEKRLDNLEKKQKKP